MDTIYAGVDVGGTNVSVALAEPTGDLIAESDALTLAYEGPAAVLKRIAEEVAALVAATGGTLAGVGVGLPGLVDLERGESLFCPNLPTNWRNVPVRAVLEHHLHCRISLLNDARMATLGELHFGLGRGVNTIVYLTLGTGIGGGIVVDRNLRLGPMGAAGELGHQTILPGGALCGCGNRGCLETLASGPAIAAEGVRLLKSGLAPALHELVAGDGGRVSAVEMAEAARRGDVAVHDALVRAASFLGIGIANLVTALHPDLVVLTGGVALIGDLLIDTIRTELVNRVRMFPPDGVRIEFSTLGKRAGVLGGIALARESAQP